MQQKKAQADHLTPLSPSLWNTPLCLLSFRPLAQLKQVIFFFKCKKSAGEQTL